MTQIIHSKFSANLPQNFEFKYENLKVKKRKKKIENKKGEKEKRKGIRLGCNHHSAQVAIRTARPNLAPLCGVSMTSRPTG
jgi:hypothetical protein